MIDWTKAQESAGGNFSPMATPGPYKAKIENIDVRETKNAQGNTSYWLDLIFADEGIRFPKISHPLSFKNDNFRVYHFMLILKELGIPEDKAKQAIENCESKKGVANIVAAYHSTFERAVSKNPAIEIEVFESDRINPNSGRPYMSAEFANKRIGFSHKSTQPQKQESVIDSGEEIALDDIPF